VRIGDTATYEQPISASVGVSAVYVNGVRTYTEGGPVLARAGSVVMRGAA
jgi:N-acyl-D-amino-acid deacylase